MAKQRLVPSEMDRQLSIKITDLPNELISKIIASMDSLKDKLNLCRVSRRFADGWLGEISDEIAVHQMFRLAGRMERHGGWIFINTFLFRFPNPVNTRKNVHSSITRFVEGESGGLLLRNRRLPDGTPQPIPHRRCASSALPQVIEPQDVHCRALLGNQSLLYHPIHDFRLPDEAPIDEHLPQLQELLDLSTEYDSMLAHILAMLPNLQTLDLSSSFSNYKPLSIVLIKAVRLRKLDILGSTLRSHIPWDIPFQKLREIRLVRDVGAHAPHVSFDMVRWMIRLPALRTIIASRLFDNNVDHGASRVGVRSNIRNVIWCQSEVRHDTLLEEIRNTTGLEVFHVDSQGNDNTLKADSIDIKSIATELSMISATSLRRLCLLFAPERLLEISSSIDDEIGRFVSLESLQCNWKALIQTPQMAKDLLLVLPHSLKTLRLFCETKPTSQQVDGLMTMISKMLKGDSNLTEISVTLLEEDWMELFEDYPDPVGVKFRIHLGDTPTVPSGFGLDEESEDGDSERTDTCDDGSQAEQSDDDSPDDHIDDWDSQDDADADEDSEDEEFIDDEGEEEDQVSYTVTGNGEIILLE